MIIVYRSEYGDVVGFYTANRPAVILSDFEDIKQVAARPLQAGRGYKAFTTLVPKVL